MKKLCVLLADHACLRRSASRRQARLVVKLMVLAFAFAQMASADPTNRYVVKDNPGAAEPYDSWDNAAGDIQTAVSYAYASDTVWVSNGVYDTGGELVYEGQSNRVAINKAITVRSANNDPTNTIIKGAWGPATNDPAAVRCVYMINGSSLIGFTLTNGATSMSGGGGGVWCGTTSIISNCVITGNSVGYYGAGAYQGKLYNCTLTGNSMPDNANSGWGGGGARDSTMYNCTMEGNSGPYGAGAYGGTLYDCTLTNNSANRWGGGTYLSTLTNCTIVGNSAAYGGGTYRGTLRNCTIVGNSATYCGGAYQGTLYNCTIVGNSASWGGGTHVSTLYNCALIGNWVSGVGGGARDSTLYNCTLTGNSAGNKGGGVYQGTNYNCISWGNDKVDYQGTWYYSCAAGISGDGTITTDPLFIADGDGFGAGHVAGNYRLSNNSPCINTGTNFSWMTTPGVRSKDLDGSPRIDNLSGQVDMGCYEHLQRRFTIIRIR